MRLVFLATVSMTGTTTNPEHSSAFPGDGTGDATTSLRGSILWKPSEACVTCKEIRVHDSTFPSSLEKVYTRHVTLHGFVHACSWHRIDFNDSYVIRRNGLKSNHTNRTVTRKHVVNSRTYRVRTGGCRVGTSLKSL